MKKTTIITLFITSLFAAQASFAQGASNDDLQKALNKLHDQIAKVQRYQDQQIDKLKTEMMSHTNKSTKKLSHNITKVEKSNYKDLLTLQAQMHKLDKKVEMQYQELFKQMQNAISKLQTEIKTLQKQSWRHTASHDA